MKNVFFLLFVSLQTVVLFAEPIDREALVKRHTVVLDRINANEVLQAGNGEIAFGIDPTGLQTFHGNTMSHWGWHSVPFPQTHNDLKLQPHNFYGRNLGLRTSAKISGEPSAVAADQSQLFNWMRENPHCFNLGRLRFFFDEKLPQTNDIKNIRQTLNLWNGTIISEYVYDNVPVKVETCCEPKSGALAVRVESGLIQQGRLQIEWSFPYGHQGNSGADWNSPDKHQTEVLTAESRMTALKRTLDTTVYYAYTNYGTGRFDQSAKHTFVFTPEKQNTFEFSVCYKKEGEGVYSAAEFAAVKQAAAEHRNNFWRTGGAIDLSGSTDERWKELERRIVLSQYLTAVNNAGSYPPQESGLYNNSGWNGKFHLEMHFWHTAHYFLWGRQELAEPSMQYYRDALQKAKELAKSQGFKGARWVKMSGPDNEDSPSGCGPYLIWQQPHPIFYAELEYRTGADSAGSEAPKGVLHKWKDVVEQSAEFMADFAHWDEKTKRYVLGPPMQTVPENANPLTCINPAYELCEWRAGLRIANQWRERLGLERNKHWDEVIAKLSPLPQNNGVYLSQEGWLDTFTKKNWEHPSLIGPNGVLPADGVDAEVAKATLEKVWTDWQFNRCWGWDFPMVAMAAAKSGRPDIAVDALLHSSQKNAYNKVGLSTGGPFPYFPSNGGLLYAAAMMCAGWDGKTEDIPAVLSNGGWKVKWEGLHKAP